MTTGCICGGSRCCDACRAADRAALVERYRMGVVNTAKWCRSHGMPMPSELRTALEQLAEAEHRASGGPR